MSVKDPPWTWSSGHWECEDIKSQSSPLTDTESFLALLRMGRWHLRKLKGRVVVVVQSLSRVRLLRSPWPAACQAPLSYTISLSLIKLTSIVLVMLSNDLTFFQPLLLLTSVFSSIRIFSNEWDICIRWPKYCSFSISPSSEYSEFISFRIGGFVLLAVQGILKGHL